MVGPATEDRDDPISLLVGQTKCTMDVVVDLRTRSHELSPYLARTSRCPTLGYSKYAPT
jgi:hypothetical protein